MGTEKRDRQRAARLDKISTQATAAKRDRSRKTALRIAVAAVVVIAVLFGVTQLMGDDGDDGSSDTETASGDCTVEAPTSAAASIDASAYSDPELAAEVLQRDPPAPEPPPADTAADALETTTVIDGEGDEAAAGSTVVVQYAGVLSDCTMFDESWSAGQPFPVTLGQGQVIPGWDDGLVGVRVGERRHLVIGSDNAYGAAGQGPIPPDAPLAFDVDVVDVQPGGADASTSTTAPAG